MITEDYVSFEIAKLLKDKGFDELCDKKYNGYKSIVPAGKMIELWQNSEFDDDEECSAPTLQMAMKWLRLKHNIYIDVYLSFSEDPEAYPAVYYVYILDTKSGNSLMEKAAHIGELNPLIDVNNHDIPITFESPEEAAEAAIKYCLNNLI